MKSAQYRSISLCLVLQLIAQGGAQADPEKPKKRESDFGEGGGRNARPMLKHWHHADLNQDGKLSFEEFQKLERIAQIPTDKQTLLFARLDKNSNSSIEPEELRPPPHGEQNERFFPNLRQIDTNKDKQISFEEFAESPFIKRLPAERQRQMFERMDRNKDGFLSPMDQPEGERPFKPGIKRGGFPDKNPPPNGGAPQPEARMRMGLEQLDTNQDGKISFSEFQAAPFVKDLGEDAQEARFESIDTNSDLQIAADEWQKQTMRKPAPKESEPPQKPQPGEQTYDSEMMEE